MHRGGIFYGIATLTLTILLTACGNDKGTEETLTGNNLSESPAIMGVGKSSDAVTLQRDLERQPVELQENSQSTLSVATWITKIGEMYYLSDCYHDQILCHENLTDPLTEWSVLTNDVHYAHTIAGDGELLVIDDTENNRLLTIHISDDQQASENLTAANEDEQSEGTAEARALVDPAGEADSSTAVEPAGEADSSTAVEPIGEADSFTAIESASESASVTDGALDGARYVWGTTFTNVGNRPHYVQYDAKRDQFLAWSSETGEMFYLKKDAAAGELEVTRVLQLEELDGIYVRSFTIEEDQLLFVSGPGNGEILQTDLETLEVTARYAVPDELAGMAQITGIQDYYYITVSTDKSGSQDAATIVRVRDLADLEQGNYEDVYADLGLCGGTPYYINEIDGRYYLTHHRTAENIIAFDVTDNEICHAEVIY